MTNEEMISRIRAGEPSLIHELWEQNQGLIYLIVKRYYNPSQGDRITSIDDLMQCAYIGFSEAVKLFDPSKECKFTSYFPYHIRNACSEEIGIRTSRVKSHNHSTSLDKPLPIDESLSLMDTLEDITAQDFIEDVEKEELNRHVNEAVERLQDEQHRTVIHDYYLCGVSLKDIGANIGRGVEEVRRIQQKGLRELRRDRILYRQHEEWQTFIHDSYYWHKSLGRFKNSGTSIVEDIVERHASIYTDDFWKRLRDEV